MFKASALKRNYAGLNLFGSAIKLKTSAVNVKALSAIDVLIVLQDPVYVSAELDRTSHFVTQLCLHNLLISRLFMPRSRFETDSPLLRNIRTQGIVL